jgi:hypothetical protein
MAKQKAKSSNNKQNARPGSSVEDARSLGGQNDFGAPESDVVARTYTSRNTKRSDPGAAQPRAGAGGARTSGVGGTQSGPGSSSAGDVDTDIIGLGTGGGIAASGKIHEPPGPDDSTGTSRDFASGPASQGGTPPRAPELVRGSTIQPPDDRTVGAGGADAASHPEAGDDAFAGEISSDEVTGRNDAGN